MPRCFPNRRGSLEEHELVRPRRKAAVAAVGVQLAEDRDERVVCRVYGEIVHVTRAAAGTAGPLTAGDLEACGAQQHTMQTLGGRFVLGSGVRQRPQPAE